MLLVAIAIITGKITELTHVKVNGAGGGLRVSLRKKQGKWFGREGTCTEERLQRAVSWKVRTYDTLAPRV